MKDTSIKSVLIIGSGPIVIGQACEFDYSEMCIRDSIIMILADNCDIDRIRAIAGHHHFSFHLAAQKKIAWETNYIFSISAQQ